MSKSVVRTVACSRCGRTCHSYEMYQPADFPDSICVHCVNELCLERAREVANRRVFVLNAELLKACEDVFHDASFYLLHPEHKNQVQAVIINARGMEAPTEEPVTNPSGIPLVKPKKLTKV